MDKDGKLLFTNGKFERQLSHYTISSGSSTLSDYIFPKDFLDFQLMLKKTLENDQRTFIMEMRIIRPDGSDFQWTRWEFSISRDNLGEVQVSALGHDIQKINEKSLAFPDFVYEYQVKNEIMEGLFDDSLIGYWIGDFSEKKDHMSESLKKMLGYEDYLDFKNGIRWQNHIHQDDREKVETTLQEHFNSTGKFPFHCDFRLKTLTGLEVWVIGYGKVIKWDLEGRPLTMVGCFFDISEKKKSEILLEKQSLFLKDLTFNQSHLMRSKLANIIGILEIMDMSSCTKEISSYIDIINKEAKKLDDILRHSISNSSAFEKDNGSV
jgi:PAS domain-containing protein